MNIELLKSVYLFNEFIPFCEFAMLVIYKNIHFLKNWKAHWNDSET